MDRQFQSERWILITDIIRNEKSVRVEDLAFRLNVSENTIRRDLNMLARKGMLQRTKGGAITNLDGISEKSFNERKGKNRDGKELIAERAASFIQMGDTIILDGGSTALLLAEKIIEKEHITVLTNSLDVAYILSDAQGITLALSGGILSSDSRTMTGSPAEQFFTRINADRLFLAVTGISAKGGLSDQNMFETPVKKKMIERADQVIVLADKSKFGRDAFSPIGDLSLADIIITDHMPENLSINTLKEKGIELIVCKKE